MFFSFNFVFHIRAFSGEGLSTVGYFSPYGTAAFC